MSSPCLVIISIRLFVRCITFYEELMLMKEFERTENELETKASEAQKRYDAEQLKVTNEMSCKRIIGFGV